MRRALIILVLPLLLAACGGSSSTPGTSTPAATSFKVYKDPTFHFSFRYPAPWTAPKKGKYSTSTGLQVYEVGLTVPNNVAGMQVTVDKDLVPYNTIPEGKIAPATKGGNISYHYHHLTVSGWPAIQIKRFSGTMNDGIDTIINTRQYSYDVRTITATPPFSPSFLDGYDHVVKTIQLPF